MSEENKKVDNNEIHNDNKNADMGEVFKKKLRNDKIKKHVKRIIIAIVLIGGYFYLKSSSPEVVEEKVFNYDEVRVSKGDVVVSVGGDGIIEANSIYTITPKVTGEILEDYVTLNEHVNKGDLLYVIDSKDVKSSINQASLAVEQSNNTVKQSNISLEQSNVALEQSNVSLEQSKINYDMLKNQLEDLKIYASSTGYVENLRIGKGSMVSNMYQICDISEKDAYEVTLQFRTSNSQDIKIGDRASLLYLDYFTYVDGYVTKVFDNTSLVTSLGSQATDVTIRVDTTGYSLQNARVEGTVFLSNGLEITSVNEGRLATKNSDVVVSHSSGTVKELLIDEGSYVKEGDLIAVLDNTTLNDQLSSAEMTIKNAEMGIKNAEMMIENAQVNRSNAEVSRKNAQNALNASKQQLDNYNITAPISGRIVYKNSKKGDVISSYQKTTSNVMATIADTETLKFEMEIDEMDISKVKLGQSVKVFVEALDNKEFEGIVSNINTIGVNVQGTTNYIVTIEVRGNDEIYSGMTVDAEIGVAHKEDVLRVPLTAVRKGDVVYKKSSDSLYQDEDLEVPQGYEKVKITMGLNDNEYVEVLEGLVEDDIVLKDKVKESGTFSLEKMHEMMVEN